MRDVEAYQKRVRIEWKDVINALRCIRCGARMRLRFNRETGQAFAGCSGYPECKWTMTMQDVEREKRSHAQSWDIDPSEDEYRAEIREKINRIVCSPLPITL